MRAYVVDSFTDQAFRGNPAGVVLLDAPADPVWMQSVAAELRHSETAFVRARDAGGFDLRWFTPAVEVDLCGHATLATAHVLAAQRGSATFSFETRSGTLTATAGPDGTITLDFPALPVRRVPADDRIGAALGTELLGTYSNGTDILVELADAGSVAALQPDIAALTAVECRGVIVTAAAGTGADHDFVSRFFAPRVGVDEDPVTGSAHCALAPFWADRLGRSRLSGAQLSARGGRVGVEVQGARVLIGGRAVTILEGDLRV